MNENAPSPDHAFPDYDLTGRQELPAEVKALLTIPGVTDVGLGFRTVQGKMTEQLAWVVYVKEKKPIGELAADERIPSQVNGLPTDVETEFDSKDLKILAGTGDETRYRDPLTGGIQIGPAGGYVGTLGCFAVRNDDRAIVFISNYHIIWASDAVQGDNIYQPGSSASPIAADIIGTVEGGTIGGPVDCAMGLLTVEDSSTCCCKRPLDYRKKVANSFLPQGAAITGTRPATMGMIVYKTGINGHTTGKIIKVSKDLPPIDYSDASLRLGSNFTLTNQILIVSYDETTQDYTPTVPFSEGGDSGSVVMDGTGRVVGLCFAHTKTSDGNYISFANHIDLVESNLGVTVLTDNPSGRATAAIDPLPADMVALGDADVADVQLAKADLSERGEAAVLDPTVHPVMDPTMHWVMDAFPELEWGEPVRKLILKHYREMADLVNHSRPVTLVWQRSYGPGWLAHFFSSLREPGYTIPEKVKGVSLPEVIVNMRKVLLQNGSRGMKDDLLKYGESWQAAARDFTTAHQFLTQLNAYLCLHKQEH